MRERATGRGGLLILLGAGLVLGGCATGQDLRETSSRLESRTDSVKSELEKSKAELRDLINKSKEEQEQIRALAAKISAELESVRKSDISKLEGRIERERRDIEGRLEYQSGQVSGWLDDHDRKLTAKLTEQLGKLQAQNKTLEERLARAEARAEGLDKVLTAVGKKTDDRLDAQDRRLEASEKRTETVQAFLKKFEADSQTVTARLTALDKGVAQVTETVKSVGAKLATQTEEHAATLAKLEETTKQADLQLRTLSPRAAQLQGSLSEFSKVLHALTEKTTDMDQRLTDLAGKSEGKVGWLVGQQGEQAAKVEKLAKRMDLEGQAAATHLNAVTQNVTALAKSLESMQARVGELAVGSGQQESQGGRVEALAKSLDGALGTLNETTRAVADLKRALEVSIGKLASRVDEQGNLLNQVVQRVQGGKGVVNAPVEASLGESSSSSSRPAASAAAKSHPETALPAESAYDIAYREFTQARYDEAMAAFRNFLVEYPDSTLVPNAHFWIGECYVRKRDYTRGIESYEQVIRQYPRSGKASAALYRKALVLLEINDRDAARAALRQLITDYPKSEESKNARTKLASLQ